MSDIKDRVYEEITTLGATNREIANKLGVTPECVRYWLNGISVPHPTNLARFHAVGLDIFYIITGKRIENIVDKSCANCRHFNDCDTHDCDFECDSCDYNRCSNCANHSNWLWEGYTDAKK